MQLLFMIYDYDRAVRIELFTQLNSTQPEITDAGV